MAIELVIFDIAGTIIQDRGEVSDSFVEALAKHSLSISADDVLEWKGAGKRAVIRHLLGRSGHSAEGEIVERIHDDFVAALNSRYICGALQPIEGSEAAFDDLVHLGLKLAVTTGFGVSTMRLILETLEWGCYFPVQVSTEEVRKGRPAPDMIFEAMQQIGVLDPRHVANIGDTPLDLQSAYAAKVACNIGVLSGMHTRQRLEREPHTHLIESIADLPALLAHTNRHLFAG
jgi:phosphonatase-like hydrolase